MPVTTPNWIRSGTKIPGNVEAMVPPENEDHRADDQRDRDVDRQDHEVRREQLRPDEPAPERHRPLVAAVSGRHRHRIAESLDDGGFFGLGQGPAKRSLLVLDPGSQAVLELLDDVVPLGARQVVPDRPQVSIDQCHGRSSSMIRLMATSSSPHCSSSRVRTISPSDDSR